MIGKLAFLTAWLAGVAGVGLVSGGGPGKTQGSNPMEELRRKVLTEPQSLYGLKVATGDPWAVIMDMSFSGASASLVCLADGNASLYFTTGGGVIGGFAHEKVRIASIAFVQMAKGFRPKFSVVKEFPLPAEGRITFYVRVNGTLLRAEAPESDLGEGRHPLSKLFHAGHEVIGQLRLITESRQ